MAPSHVGVCLSWRIFAGVDNDERFLIAKSEFWWGWNVDGYGGI